MNNGELNAEDWIVKTTADTARIVVYNGDNGSITFNVPFIEDVSSETLASVGPDGQEFVESSGGTITVTNNGSMNKQSTGASGLEYIIYIIIIVVAVAVSIFVIFRNRKKQREASVS
jgi:hypothetical protein